jgi:hypothetical protein
MSDGDKNCLPKTSFLMYVRRKNKVIRLTLHVLFYLTCQAFNAWPICVDHCGELALHNAVESSPGF